MKQLPQPVTIPRRSHYAVRGETAAFKTRSGQLILLRT